MSAGGNGKSAGRFGMVDSLSVKVVCYAAPITPADTPAMRNGVSLLSALRIWRFVTRAVQRQCATENASEQSYDAFRRLTKPKQGAPIHTHANGSALFSLPLRPPVSLPRANPKARTVFPMTAARRPALQVEWFLFLPTTRAADTSAPPPYANGRAASDKSAADATAASPLRGRVGPRFPCWKSRAR